MASRRIVVLVLTLGLVTSISAGAAAAADPPGPIVAPFDYWLSAASGPAAVEWSVPDTGGEVTGWEVTGPDGPITDIEEEILPGVVRAVFPADLTRTSVLVSIRAIGPGGDGPETIVEVQNPNPGPPQDLRAETSEDGWVTLTWAPPSHLPNSVISYWLFEDDRVTPIASTSPNERTYRLPSSPGSERTVLIRSQGSRARGPFAAITFTVPLVRPGQVSDVSAAVNDAPPQRATITWSAPEEGGVVTEYEITSNMGSRRVPGDFRSTFVNVDSSVPDIDVTVRAIGPGGVGPPVTVAAGGPRLPGQPEELTTRVVDGDLVVEWDPPSFSGSEPITGYLVVVHDQIIDTAPNETRAVVSGLPTRTELGVLVRARNPVGRSPSVRTTAVLPGRPGYWMSGRSGELHGFGAAGSLGAVAGEVVALATDAAGGGLWVLDAGGVVHVRGGAEHLGDVDVSVLDVGERVSSIAVRPGGDGYWVFTDRGRVFAFGAAQHHGDLTEFVLNGAIVASAATADGGGYWLVGSDGGIFSFGNAVFDGSTGSLTLNEPVVGIAPDPDGGGYWLVAADGGIFAFEAEFRGSVPGVLAEGAVLNAPVIGTLAFGEGYLMVASDGGIFNFSDEDFLGSLGGQPLDSPIVGVAAFVG
ncbi:MAG: fibronectin type III domain-containing protein [Actinomycetota bacterium]